MNIKQAKDYIKDTVRIYLKKDEFGDYRIPVMRQRPVFLLGAPGIGKTAIMEQIAQEMGIALVAYSMTHHTRQSALGLPFIVHKNYGGLETDVSEYTMSEIISAIYQTMEESGIREGILFLDEINCVSETLAPSMLQFLQYKVFGRHKVPEGWVIVTAGNPPEYNKSVREFDVVTYDRLKVLEVEPDLKAWKEYASGVHIHGAILNYLDLKKEHFYYMETTAKGRSFVTARGWEDLSEILKLYEEEGLKADETLIGQYLRNDRIVKEFTAYYELYNKYKKDYSIGKILEGEASPETILRAQNAPFDERLSLLGMLLDRMQADMKEVCGTASYLADLRGPLLAVKSKPSLLEKQIEGRKKVLNSLQKANSLSDADRRKHRQVIAFLEEGRSELLAQGLWSTDSATDGTKEPEDGEAFALLKKKYESRVAQLKEETEAVKRRLHALFSFAEEAFADGNEMLILVTELTVNPDSAQFIASFGSPDYQKHNQELMLSERQDEIKAQIAGMEL